jgi:hypothetical protein
MQALDLPGLDVECEVIEGTQRDAIMYACGVNSAHGIQRTVPDKQNAVKTMLKNPLVSLNEDGVPWSDRAIAKICKVHHQMVGKWRAEVTGGSSSQRSYTHNKSGQTTVMNTGGINQDRQQPSSEQAPSEAKTPIVVVEPSDRASPADAKTSPLPEAQPSDQAKLGGYPTKGGEVVEFKSKWDFIYEHLKEIDRAIAELPDPDVAAAKFPETLAHGLTVERCLEIQHWWLDFTRYWAARNPGLRRRHPDFFEEA